jgi:hypothetical protein
MSDADLVTLQLAHVLIGPRSAFRNRLSDSYSEVAHLI